jgi:hypothetical protein
LTAMLVRDIREEVIGLLFNRYVFRTHQEIVRLNPRLRDRPRSIFGEWGWVVYAVTNVVGVRRLASGTYMDGDINLVRLLDMFIREPGGLWESFRHYYPQDATRAHAEILRKGQQLPPDWESLASKRLLGEDRKVVINAAEKASQFASKRAAHSAPKVEVHTTFSDLDNAIDVVKKITEKYTLIVGGVRRQSVDELHRAGASTVNPMLVQMDKTIDLLEEMKRRKLPEGWDAIFLEPWATPEIIGLPLGETEAPRSASGD